MIVEFDLDGVLYPWHEEVWKWYNNRSTNNISFIEFWKYPNGWIHKNEGTAIVKALVNETLPYVSAKAKESDVSIVDDIVKDFNAEIYYITSRPERFHYDTAKWLKDSKFPFTDNLIMADGNGGKVKVVKDVGCDIFVEDRPKYLTALAEVTNVVKVVTPYNTYEAFHAHPIGNLVELYNYIDHFYGENNA